MGQQRLWAAGAIAAIAAAVVLAWLFRQSATAPLSAAKPTIASITPAGTDLIIGIGAADHLVGVSNFDDDRQGVAGKLKIGDYQTIDWEKLAMLRPQILMVYYAADRIPDAVSQRCADLNIRLVNVKLEVLDDIYREMKELAEALGVPGQGEAAAQRLKDQLQAVGERVRVLPAVKTAIVTNESSAIGLAGPDTFLDEILTVAGGTNVAAGADRRYPSVDREKLMALAPDAVIQLIPDGDRTPNVMDEAKRFWASMPDLPAVKNHRVYFVTDWYAEQPGFRVGQLAQEFAEFLHPELKP